MPQSTPDYGGLIPSFKTFQTQEAEQDRAAEEVEQKRAKVTKAVSTYEKARIPSFSEFVGAPGKRPLAKQPAQAAPAAPDRMAGASVKGEAGLAPRTGYEAIGAVGEYVMEPVVPFLKSAGKLLKAGVTGKATEAVTTAYEMFGKPQVDQFKQAYQMWEKGGGGELKADLPTMEMVGHFLAGVIPFEGPIAAQSAEALGQGDYRHASQGAIMLALPFLGKAFKAMKAGAAPEAAMREVVSGIGLKLKEPITVEGAAAIGAKPKIILPRAQTARIAEQVKAGAPTAAKIKTVKGKPKDGLSTYDPKTDTVEVSETRTKQLLKQDPTGKALEDTARLSGKHEEGHAQVKAKDPATIEAAIAFAESTGRKADAARLKAKGEFETYKGEEQFVQQHTGVVNENTVIGEQKAVSKGTEPAQRVSGIAHEVEAARRASLGDPALARGEGISPQAAVERGQDLLKNGADPQAVAAEFKSTGKIDADSIAVVRAQKETLERAANAAYDKGGETSSAYQAAEKAVRDWYDSTVKPMQTEWHRTGQAQQGVVDVDTGSFLGLKRAFYEATAKDFTPQQATKARVIAKGVQTATDAADATRATLVAEVEKAYPEPALAQSGAWGSTNKIFTNEKLTAAIERLREKGKILRGSGGPSPEELADLATIAGYHLEAGARTLAQFSKRMVAEVGEWVRPYLPDLYRDARSAVVTENLRAEFANKTDSLFSRPQLNGIWQQVRSYVDRGVTDYDDIRAGVAADLGLTTKQVTKALSENRSVKRLSDEMYRRMSTLRQVKGNARGWVASADDPTWWRAIKATPRFFFGAKTFGHGTVGMITHAGKNIFIPETWGAYFPNFFKQFKLAYDSGFHERSMQELVRRPDYTTARRAGLANDPVRYYDDYQNPVFAKYFGKIGLVGTRGFDSLKLFRQDLFDQYWQATPDAMRTPEQAKMLAVRINHATGAVNRSMPPGANLAFFAPQLEGSRWMWAIGDPLKAGKIFATWNRASAAEKYFAKTTMRQSGEMIATYASLLALNEGLMRAMGSPDHVNFTDPQKPDWLRFKAGGHTVVDVSGGMVSLLTYLTRMGIASGHGMGIGKAKGGEKPFEEMSKLTGKYVRGKLSPIASTATDVATTTDYMGRPLPFSKVKPHAGDTKYSWSEYLMEQQTPIPVSEAFRATVDTMKSRGMSKVQIRDLLEGVGVGLVSGGTGARVMVLEPQKQQGGWR